MRTWKVTGTDGQTHEVKASDAAAALTYIVALKRIYEHREVVSVIAEEV